ncbi:hypothetical protein GA0115261_102044 [Streptomyces sp. OspMP-M43]|nr:hypothetical protein GA0115261_102044 [Streptomyces sp. OspMP-M43]
MYRDRARAGSEHQLIIDRHTPSLSLTLSSGNQLDATQLQLLLNAVHRSGDCEGAPPQPRRLYAHRGYDFDKYRRLRGPGNGFYLFPGRRPRR